MRKLGTFTVFTEDKRLYNPLFFNLICKPPPKNYILHGAYQAERPGFEPGIPFRGIHAFQACLFSHSSISPDKTQK